MGIPGNIEFEDTIRRRIYDHVERHGAVSVEDLHDAIRVAESTGSKPARSGTTEPPIRMPPAEFDEHVSALTEDGYLVKHEGDLHLALGEGTEEYTEDDLTYRIRPARQSDRRGIVTAIREVADEGASVAASRVAAEVDDEGALLRHNDHRSRMFFVATIGDDAEADADGGDAENEGEVAGWVHVDAPEIDELRHTAELTVGVRGPFREHGIGGSLLNRAIEWARDTGYRKVYQSLPETNETAIDLLEDHGWETEAVRADHYLVGDEYVDEVMMARDL